VGPSGGEPKSYRRWLGVVVALVLSMLVAVVLLTLQPLEPLPASAPTDEFSAERAFTHVEEIAQQPHPVGSDTNADVREYLLRQLEDIGLQPTVQATTAAQTLPDGTSSLARVSNIHARIEGMDPTGHVVLVAHHDSAPNSLGTADDGAGVATILEISRALTIGSPPRKDIDVVLTDAEEPGLLGAQAFVDAGRLDPQRSVVLNLEARGTSGPTFMFETSLDNANVVPALTSARRPIAGSETATLYGLLPNDTDFTVFDRAGFAGMNFAFVDRSAHYHTPGDSPSNLDSSSLQHMGATVLDVARHLARQDLGAPRGGPLTYSSVLGQLVYYPQVLALPLAVLAAVAFAATVLYARRRGLRVSAVAVAAAGFLALLVVTGGLGVAAWKALMLFHPGYGSFLTGDTYRPEWYAAGLLALAAALTIAWYLLMRRRSKPEEVAVAIWAWLVVLALITAVFVPGAAYVFTWPALVGCCALAAAIRWVGDDPTWRRLLRGRRAGHRVAPAAGRLLHRTRVRRLPHDHRGPGSGHRPAGPGSSGAAPGSCRWRFRWWGSSCSPPGCASTPSTLNTPAKSASYTPSMPTRNRPRGSAPIPPRRSGPISTPTRSAVTPTIGSLRTVSSPSHRATTPDRRPSPSSRRRTSRWPEAHDMATPGTSSFASPLAGPHASRSTPIPQHTP
jgi:hypothetical protein